VKSEQAKPVLTATTDVLAGRSLAAILLVFGDRRSLAPYYCWCLARERRLVGYCLFMSGEASRHLAGVRWVRPILGRSRLFAIVGTQRNAPRRWSPHRRSPERISGEEWSGLQSWRVRPGRGRNRADACTERLRGSVGAVKPGCVPHWPPFQSEERQRRGFSCLTSRTQTIELHGHVDCPRDIRVDGASNACANVAKGPRGWHP
jgi:hypothetical protein